MISMIGSDPGVDAPQPPSVLLAAAEDEILVLSDKGVFRIASYGFGLCGILYLR
jgi:hypothetical protein